MARRHSRYDGGGRSRGARPRRWAVFSLAALAVVAAAVWIAPTILVLTELRDRPLTALFAGIDGSVSSGEARWHWLGGIEYRDIVLRDAAGRTNLMVPRVVIDRGLLQLAVDPDDLGTVRLVAPEALVEVRRGGSSLEDILAPWLAAVAAGTARPMSFELEVVDAAVELRDVERRDAWRLSDVLAAGTVRSDATLAGWTVAGRLRHVDPPAVDASARVAASPAAPSVEPAEASARLDRTTIAAGATAVLARDGGFSVSSPAGAAESRAVTLAAHRLPLGASSLLATRFETAHLLDGLADIRLDLATAAAGARISGSALVTQLAICRADTLAEVAGIERCEVPIDCSLEGDRLVVRTFAAQSPLFRAEASGRIRLPTAGSWAWGEGLIEEDFAIAADVDLAAASRAIAGGLAVRPDVRVTDGRLQVAAASRADGDDRVLEVRVTSRDLAAVQSVVEAASPDEANAKATVRERPLRWNEPFTAWLRGRRSRGDQLRIEDARIASNALEVSASGNAADATVQWTLDIDRLVAEAAELLDLGETRVAGSSRGRIHVSRADPAAAADVKVIASLTDFELTSPGRPAWRDKEITLEAEGSGRIAGGAALVDQAHALVAGAGDRLEATLTGGVIVGIEGLLGRGGDAPWLRAAPGAAGISADCSLAGDLARWHARFAAFEPTLAAAGVELGGTLEAAAAINARGDAWQITRAGGAVEKLLVRTATRQIREPRLVATAAGLIHPATGQVDISSGEILTATLSLRTGGLSWMAPRRRHGEAAAGDLVRLFERLRGKAQWRANVNRLEQWLLPPETVSQWPASGELSGTVELVDATAGVNLLVEASGTQLVVARGGTPAAAGRPGGGGPQPVWSEPRARLSFEVTRPYGADAALADRVQIDRIGLESTTVALAARGGISEWATRRVVDLDGSVSYDWAQVCRLLTPWTGGSLRVAGAGTRPFAFRGPLGDVRTVATAAPPAAAASPTPETLLLPDDWLSAARGREGADGDRAARLATPVKAAAPPRRTLADRLRAFSIDTSAAWTAAEIGGLPLDAGETAVRLVEGQLAFGPFDIGAAGGRLRGAPWMRLAPGPAELVVPAGRVVDRVALSGPLCDRWVSWLSPLLGHATHTQGVVTIDVAGARLPLDDAFAGEMTGQVIFGDLEVTPAATVQPLVNLLAKLQAVVDPRFAFGDKTVLMRVRPEPMRVRLVDRRLWHEGLVMDAGQLTVKSSGSVGADGTLAMVVEVALRGDIAGQTPVVAQLLRTPLAIPLKGTVERPQFDARSIDVILGRIVENTAQAVLNDGLNRGLESLETLFGNPPAPAPLALPAGTTP